MHGDGVTESQVELMMRGQGWYAGLQLREDVYNTGKSSESEWELVLNPILHRSKSKVIYDET